MKRDFELIRNILLVLERVEDYNSSYFELKNTIEVETNYLNEHIRLLKEAGYVETSIQYLLDGSILISPNIRINWEGHEFLQQIKNETVWEQINNKLLDLKSFSLPIIQNLAVEALKKMVA